MYLVKTEASELLTLLFSMKDEPENTPIPTKAAKAMCWNLVDAGLGFEKLHSVASQAREIGPSNHLESVMRQTFLSKISGFPADEVDQVIFCSKKLFLLCFQSLSKHHAWASILYFFFQICLESFCLFCHLVNLSCICYNLFVELDFHSLCFLCEMILLGLYNFDNVYRNCFDYFHFVSL